jgi:hypothetical protein
VAAAKNGSPIDGAFIGLDGDRRHNALTNASSGRADLRTGAGRHRLRSVSIGFEKWEEEIDVRAGYFDTLFVGLGNSTICFT